MLSNIFNPNNGFFRFCGKLADILMLSLLWLVCCIPVVTVATSSAALYNSAVKCVKNGENQPYIKFRDFMKENFKDGIAPSILIVAIALLFSFEMVSLWGGAASGSRMSFTFLIALVICSFLPASYLVWVTSIFSRYVFSFGQLAVTSFKFIFAHLFSSAVMGILMVVTVILCYGFVFPITFMPCLLAVINSVFIEKCFAKHTKHVPETHETTEDAQEANKPLRFINNRF